MKIARGFPFRNPRSLLTDYFFFAAFFFAGFFVANVITPLRR